MQCSCPLGRNWAKVSPRGGEWALRVGWWLREGNDDLSVWCHREGTHSSSRSPVHSLSPSVSARCSEECAAVGNITRRHCVPLSHNKHSAPAPFQCTPLTHRAVPFPFPFLTNSSSSPTKWLNSRWRHQRLVLSSHLSRAAQRKIMTFQWKANSEPKMHSWRWQPQLALRSVYIGAAMSVSTTARAPTARPLPSLRQPRKSWASASQVPPRRTGSNSTSAELASRRPAPLYAETEILSSIASARKTTTSSQIR